MVLMRCCCVLCCLQPVFELLLWSVEQVQEYRAPTFELAVSVLQVISQVNLNQCSNVKHMARGVEGAQTELWVVQLHIMQPESFHLS